MKMKILSYVLLSLALLLSACLFDSDTEEEKESKSSSSTEVISSSSSAKVTSSSSSVTTNKSSSSGSVVNPSSSSENPPESSSSSVWVDYPYYSSGVFCFTEGCEDNPTSSSSSEESSSSSSEIIMSSSSQLDAIIEGGVMLDRRDNQTYEIITLNDKIWMAQNIGYETPSGSFCYEDKETNCDDYGRLYTYEAAQSACPGGWHIATRAEFEEAMAEPTFLWLYAGRMNNNTYNFVDSMGFHWVDGPIESSDNDNCRSDQCALIFVQKNPDSAADPALFFQKDNKMKGFNVRCVKN